MVEILTHVDITFFTQNKPMNYHSKSDRRFVGCQIYIANAISVSVFLVSLDFNGDFSS
jgi:hypothetical protein